jgi:hypothetical protein
VTDNDKRVSLIQVHRVTLEVDYVIPSNIKLG